MKQKDIKARRGRYFLTLLLLFAAIGLQAQELTVKSFGVAQGDLDARSSTTRRTDRNGTPCALVKVQLPLQGAVFDGVVGDVQFKAGEYWAYLPNGAYLMSIKHPQFHKLELNLRSLWNGEERFYGVEQLTTYNLIINVPQTGQVDIDDGMRYLALTVIPTNSTVEIDGQVCTIEADGTTMVRLSQGPHTYRATAPSYAEETGSLTIGDGTLKKTISLQSLMATVQVSCPTPGVQIYMNEKLKGGSPWSGTLAAGNYLFEARLEGYRTGKTSVKLADRDNRQITIPALVAITGTLDVSYRPMDAEVWIDGKKSGTSPNIFRNITVGTHNIEIRLQGYQSERKQVTIREGQTEQVAGSLQKTSVEGEGMTAAQMNSLGDDYHYGRNGKAQNYQEAVKWYRMAAEQGYANGQVNWGYMYENGYGVEKNYTEAVKWFRKAAEQGHAAGQRNLGYMYENGYGVEKNLATAKSWYEKAAAQGDDFAKKRLEALK